MPPGSHFDLEVMGQLVLKYQTRTIDKNHKDFLIISSIHAYIFVSKCLIIPKLLAKKATHFILEVSAVYVISSFYVINCFKYFLIYILGQCLKKTDKKKFKLYQVFMC